MMLFMTVPRRTLPVFRPDLSTGALSYEDDLEGMTRDLGASEAEAKEMKDVKDVEKLPEG